MHEHSVPKIYYTETYSSIPRPKTYRGDVSAPDEDEPDKSGNRVRHMDEHVADHRSGKTQERPVCTVLQVHQFAQRAMLHHEGGEGSDKIRADAKTDDDDDDLLRECKCAHDRIETERRIEYLEVHEERDTRARARGL